MKQRFMQEGSMKERMTSQLKNTSFLWLLILILAAPMAEAAEYEYVGILTSDNLQSGAPANYPSCPCAEVGFNGINVVECPLSGFRASPLDFVRTSGQAVLPEICYDEYVPTGENRGWAHVLVFKQTKKQ